MDDEENWSDELRGALDGPRRETLVDGEELSDSLETGLFPPRRADLPEEQYTWIELRDEREAARTERGSDHDDWFILDEGPTEVGPTGPQELGERPDSGDEPVTGREDWFILDEGAPGAGEGPYATAPSGQFQEAVSDAHLPEARDLDADWQGVELGPSQSLFAREGYFEQLGIDTTDHGPRERHYDQAGRIGARVIRIGIGVVVLVALLAVVLAVRRQHTPTEQVILSPSQLTALRDAAEAAQAEAEAGAADETPVTLGPVGDGVLSDQALVALTLLGVGPEAVASSQGQILIDNDPQKAVPGQPRIEQAGALVVELPENAFDEDDERASAENGLECGRNFGFERSLVGTVCDETFLSDRRDKYLVVWVDTAAGFLQDSGAGAGVQVSFDTDGDGRIDIPASLTGNGKELPTLADGREDSPAMATVVGKTVFFAVPIGETVPQWAVATSATTGPLTDVTDWQRWVIERDGRVRLQQVDYGEDVRA